eukprot:13584172-Heterocapsa_arctica.AAC.1
MLRERHGVRFNNDSGGIDDEIIAVLEMYRAPPCVRCSTRTDMYIDMEIQVDDNGLARWQCEICIFVLSWEHYRQLALPPSLGSSEDDGGEPEMEL